MRCKICGREFRHGDRLIEVLDYYNDGFSEGADREDPEYIHYDHLVAAL